MITKLEAIQSLRPLAEFTLRGEELEWLDNNQTEPTNSEIESEIARLEAEYAANQYRRDRASNYPSIGDQLDMIYWDLKNGTQTFVDAIEAIKVAHPKP